MLERRFFIPEKAYDIHKIENDSCFHLIGDFDNGNIYTDILSENHDLYYVEHDLMSDEEKDKYAKLQEEDV